MCQKKLVKLVGEDDPTRGAQPMASATIRQELEALLGRKFLIKREIEKLHGDLSAIQVEEDRLWAQIAPGPESQPAPQSATSVPDQERKRRRSVEEAVRPRLLQYMQERQEEEFTSDGIKDAFPEEDPRNVFDAIRRLKDAELLEGLGRGKYRLTLKGKMLS